MGLKCGFECDDEDGVRARVKVRLYEGAGVNVRPSPPAAFTDSFKMSNASIEMYWSWNRHMRILTHTDARTHT